MNTIPLSQIVLWHDNPHQGNVDLLVKDFRTFGFNGAVRLWRDHVVMGGNHCVKALNVMKADGRKPPHGITIDETGDWLIPYIDITHLSKRKAEAFAIADNRTAELSTNDDQLLAGLLSQIAIDDPALLPAVGYTQDEIDELLGLIGNDDNGGAGDDSGAGDDTDKSDSIPSFFSVIVDCKNEAEQTVLIDRLLGEGFKVKAQTL
jgi:hypothetical protein